jgi:hypothetical protein
MMARERGAHFNPDLLDTFFSLIDDMVSIKEAWVAPDHPVTLS